MRSIVLVLSLLLAWPVAAKVKPQVPAELAPTHGFVYVAYPKGGSIGLQVRLEGGGKPIMLDSATTASPMAGAQAFGRWLPPGQYRLGAWGAMKWENGPVFEVQAGRVTDLGGLVPVNIGGYQIVMMPVRHAENAGDLALATQSFRELLKDPAPIVVDIAQVSAPMTLVQPATGLGLIADLLIAHDRKINKPSTLEQLKAATVPADFLRLARTVMPPLQDEPAILPDGTLYFTADLGQIRKRSPDGQWSNIGMDTLRQTLAVEYANGRLIAGSDDGHLRSSEDGGSHWNALKSLKISESIIDIDHADGQWVLASTETFDDPTAPRSSGMLAAAATARSVRLRVYTGHSDDLSDLSLSKEFVLTPRDQIGWMGARGQLVDGRYYITIAPNVYRLELASGEWTTLAPGPRVGSLRVDRKTGTLSALWSQGAFSKVYVSSDHGDSWTQIGRPPYVIFDVQMDASDTGWASRWNMDAFSGKWELYRYVPAKNDWEQTGEAPFNCKPLRVSAEIPLLCIANDASIFSMRADGTWEVEFSAR